MLKRKYNWTWHADEGKEQYWLQGHLKAKWRKRKEEIKGDRDDVKWWWGSLNTKFERRTIGNNNGVAIWYQTTLYDTIVAEILISNKVLSNGIVKHF